MLTDALAEHADVVFPAEAYPEKEGTVVHPDGRVQRVRAAVGHPGPLDTGVRATWKVIDEIARRCGLDFGITAERSASQQLFEAVPFYRGLSLERIGGKGVRWPELNPDGFAAWAGTSVRVPPARDAGAGPLRVGLRPSLWASDEVDASPSLAFLRARQVVEISAADAAERGIFDGDRVEVGGVVQGIARVRAAIPTGTIFLIAGASDSPGYLLEDASTDVVRLSTNGDASAVPVLATPAAEGLAEMPPSAPLDLPPTQGQPS